MIKNAYVFGDGAGLTLTDKVGAANGTLAGASLPTWAANQRYLNFSGGHHTTAGNYNRVEFTRTTFDYTTAGQFTWVIAFKSSKDDAAVHALFGNIDASQNIRNYNYITAAEVIGHNIRDSAPANKYLTSAATYTDGKWHLLVVIYNNNVISGFIDGIALPVVANDVLSGNLYSANGKATMGAAYTNTATNYVLDLTGAIGLFKNFNTAHSVARAKNEYSYYKGFF